MAAGVRFSPQVIPFILTFVAMFYAAQGAFVSFIHLWYGKSYRQVEFVMDEWRENAGHPYVAGHLAPGAEPSPFHLPGRVADGKRVLEEAPGVTFEAGKLVKVWYSPDAPFTSYNGESANGVPVDALPERPGWGRFLLGVVLTIAAAVLGFLTTGWVGTRFARLG